MTATLRAFLFVTAVRATIGFGSLMRARVPVCSSVSVLRAQRCSTSANFANHRPADRNAWKSSPSGRALCSRPAGATDDRTTLEEQYRQEVYATEKAHAKITAQAMKDALREVLLEVIAELDHERWMDTDEGRAQAESALRKELEAKLPSNSDLDEVSNVLQARLEAMLPSRQAEDSATQPRRPTDARASAPTSEENRAWWRMGSSPVRRQAEAEGSVDGEARAKIERLKAEVRQVAADAEVRVAAAEKRAKQAQEMLMAEIVALRLEARSAEADVRAEVEELTELVEAHVAERTWRRVEGKNNLAWRFFEPSTRGSGAAHGERAMRSR